MRRASDLTTRSRALHEIQEALGLEEAPLRIECYDVSNLQGTNVVASAVVFEDGLARKSEYRRFSIKGTGGEGDVASIHEVISRRFRRYLEEREATGELDVLGDPAGEFATRDPAGGDPAAEFPASRRATTGGATTGGATTGGATTGGAATGRSGPAPLDEDGRPRKFAYPPNLVVIDGG